MEITNPLSSLKQQQENYNSNKDDDDEDENVYEIKKKFEENGFSIFQNVLSSKTVNDLNERLEFVLRGVYDRKRKPDKTPKVLNVGLPSQTGSGEEQILKETRTQQQQGTVKQSENVADCSSSITNAMKKISVAKGPLGYSGNKIKKVYQIVNIHKSDVTYRKLVKSPILGELVSKLMGWKDGARFVQDQIWAKPAGAPCLSYHRDSPYFMFNPPSVATIWIALDDMTEDLGPITYVPKSHKWGVSSGCVNNDANTDSDGRTRTAKTNTTTAKGCRIDGSMKHFFQSRNTGTSGGKSLLYHAAKQNGIDNPHRDLTYVSTCGLEAGGLSIHNGLCWHGSNGNKSQRDQPRRSIGLHYVPVNARWTMDARKSKLWSSYVDNAIDQGIDLEQLELDEEDFPVTWRGYEE